MIIPRLIMRSITLKQEENPRTKTLRLVESLVTQKVEIAIKLSVTVVVRMVIRHHNVGQDRTVEIGRAEIIRVQIRVQIELVEITQFLVITVVERVIKQISALKDYKIY